MAMCPAATADDQRGQHHGVNAGTDRRNHRFRREPRRREVDTEERVDIAEVTGVAGLVNLTAVS